MEDIVEKRRRAREHARKPHVKARILARNRKMRGCGEPTRPPSEACELCGKRPNKALCLDHDHDTGKFRGWLCNTCNSGIGMLGDTIESLAAAIHYLQKAQ